jgi:hypothetical protein
MSIANVLLRSLGQGASSLGGMRFQEQERRRQEEAAEAMRVRQAQEMGEQRIALQREKQADLERQQQEGAAVARLMGVELPENARLTPDAVRLLAEDRRQKGMDGRTTASIEGMRDRLDEQGRQMGELRAAQAAANSSRAALLDRTDPNIRGGRGGGAGPEDEERRWLMGRISELMKPGVDDFGRRQPGLPAEEARRRAESEVGVVFGRPSAPQRPREAPGARLMQGMGGGFGGRPSPASFDRRR